MKCNDSVDANFIDEATVQQVVEQVMRIAGDQSLSENTRAVALQAISSVLDTLRRSVETHYDLLEEIHA